MNWLETLVSQHSELESPKNFWYWSGLTILSAVMKDQVYLDRGGVYKLYPNIYVMLHADSGLKKGPPVGLAKDLVKRVNNTRIIAGRSSIQGILKELGTAYTVPGGRPITKSVGFIVSSEFSSSIVADPAAMTILTDLYDRQYNEGEYRSLLKMESFQLKDPTLTMLVATNEAHFDDFIASKDIKGGFIGRMFVIAESQVQRLNSLIAPLSNPPNREKYIEYLKELAPLHGPFRPLGARIESDEFNILKRKATGNEYFTKAGKLYDDWYEDFYTALAQNEQKDATGTVQRFGDSVLKVAMLLALADKPELVIERQHIEEAIRVMEPLLGNVRKTTLGKRGKSEKFADKQALVMREITNRPGYQVTQKFLLKKYEFDLRLVELEEIMITYERAGYIKIKTMGDQIVYEMPKEIGDKLKLHFQGKTK